MVEEYVGGGEVVWSENAQSQRMAGILVVRTLVTSVESFKRLVSVQNFFVSRARFARSVSSITSRTER